MSHQHHFVTGTVHAYCSGGVRGGCAAAGQTCRQLQLLQHEQSTSAGQLGVSGARRPARQRRLPRHRKPCGVHPSLCPGLELGLVIHSHHTHSEDGTCTCLPETESTRLWHAQIKPSALRLSASCCIRANCHLLEFLQILHLPDRWSKKQM